jgi:hypothetical protein
MFCSPVGRDTRLTDFIVSALSIFLGIDVVVGLQGSVGWVGFDGRVGASTTAEDTDVM